MKNKHLVLLALITAFLVSACQKDYAVDGGKSEAQVNMTTYDYLKSKSIFSDLVRLIDRAGLKDAINSQSTFFATTNYGVEEYRKAMKNKRATELGNENIVYTLDSIPLWRLDSLKTYIFQGKINRDGLTQNGDYYPTNFGQIANTRFKLNLSRNLNYGYVGPVDFIVYTKVIGTDDRDELDQNTIPIDLRDKSVFVQSSGILTTNGVVHALDGFHRLFFNADNAN